MIFLECLPAKLSAHSCIEAEKFNRQHRSLAAADSDAIDGYWKVAPLSI
jgi:hypothetical protein